MQKDELTAILAALLIGSRRQDFSPQQAVEIAEEIQRTIEANVRAANLAMIEDAKTGTRALLRKLNPDN